MVTQKVSKSHSFLKGFSLIVVMVWVSVILISLLWNHHQVKNQAEMIATNVANAYFDKDLAFRLWGAKHGGVYAPISAFNPPNPYLSHVQERDITTPAGKKLTLVNPAYMIRQMMSEFSELTGVGGHLTSLKLLNPINKPDAWEEENLKEFDKGVKEAKAFVDVDGQLTLRLMRPFITKKQCLKCHAHQGYEVGDVRGATSLSIPMKPYNAIEDEMWNGMVLTHVLLLVLGVLGIGFGYWRIKENIAQHITLENDLLRQNEFTDNIINALSHPFLVFDADNYTIELANSAALGDATLSGQTCYSLSHNRSEPCCGDEHPCPITLMKENGQPVTVEHTHYDANGTPINVEIQCYPLFDEKGKVSKVVEYAVDVTERHAMEKEKGQLQDQLQQAQKMEAIGQLSGGVAHDFNNLLTAIIGYTELSISSLESDNPVQQHLSIVHETGQKAAILTRQLLAFSRKQVLEIQPVCLDVLIADMIKMLSRVLGEDVDIQLKLNGNDAVIMGDPAQLEQVVLNLAVNGRDAMPEGGKLLFETELVTFGTDAKSLYDCMLPGKYLQFSVSDSGKGMSDETQKRLFEPFFTTKEKGKGTGLGLSTVYGIVKQHHSFIYVYSELGVGSTFKVYLPLATGELLESHDKHNSLIDNIPTGNETIMVVDDERQIVGFVMKSLESLGYTTIGRNSPEDAIAYVEEHPDEKIDLLLVDVIMPAMNGKELAEKIRCYKPGILVIFMSGYTDSIIARQGMLDKGIMFLQKPLTPSTLGVKIREVLDGGDV